MGQRVMERHVKANLAAVNTALKPYGERVKQVAVASTYSWYWFVDGLRSQGWHGHLAHPAKMDHTATFNMLSRRMELRKETMAALMASRSP